MDLGKATTALVTGANGGIGQAIARALHAEGVRLILSGRRADALAPIAAELGARVVVADLQRSEDVRRCLDECGPIDILVANAALPSSGRYDEFSEEEIDRALDVNLRAPIMMARRVAPEMTARGRGQIIFISSVAGRIATGRTSIYSATKFGLRGFALALREDLRDSGVGVTTIYPGFIRDAGMFAATGYELPKSSGTRSPEDVARAVMRAVHHNPDEIIVAAMDQAFGAFLGGVSHRLVIALARALGSDSIGREIAAKQAHRR